MHYDFIDQRMQKFLCDIGDVRVFLYQFRKFLYIVALLCKSSKQTVKLTKKLLELLCRLEIMKE